MRWTRLFADLESRLDAERDADLTAEVAERTRIEVGKVALVDRLRAAVGRRVVITTVAGTPYAAQVEAIGPDWLVVVDDWQDERLISLSSVAAIGQLPTAIAAPYDEARRQIAARLDLRHALRGIARDRSAVRVTTIGAVTMSGTIDRVGADFIDLAEHHLDESRRIGKVTSVQTLPIGAFVEAVRLNR
ncbi:hypothetical protein [Antricoccus suffuscus]|uniref:hypothetical protein n=1 Tax=Antricoccus suffuscus TaxID=1629062 RepID=UPI0011B2685F|nr:hypothetical protein [Antricoccus suffuscus]